MTSSSRKRRRDSTDQPTTPVSSKRLNVPRSVNSDSKSYKELSKSPLDQARLRRSATKSTKTTSSSKPRVTKDYYELKEIRDERWNKEKGYKEYWIEWEGENPGTKKPWPNSWEPEQYVNKPARDDWVQRQQSTATQDTFRPSAQIDETSTVELQSPAQARQGRRSRQIVDSSSSGATDERPSLNPVNIQEPRSRSEPALFWPDEAGNGRRNSEGPVVAVNATTPFAGEPFFGASQVVGSQSTNQLVQKPANNPTDDFVISVDEANPFDGQSFYGVSQVLSSQVATQTRQAQQGSERPQTQETPVTDHRIIPDSQSDSQISSLLRQSLGTSDKSSTGKSQSTQAVCETSPARPGFSSGQPKITHLPNSTIDPTRTANVSQVTKLGLDRSQDQTQSEPKPIPAAHHQSSAELTADVEAKDQSNQTTKSELAQRSNQTAEEHTTQASDRPEESTRGAENSAESVENDVAFQSAQPSPTSGAATNQAAPQEPESQVGSQEASQQPNQRPSQQWSRLDQDSQAKSASQATVSATTESYDRGKDRSGVASLRLPEANSIGKPSSPKPDSQATTASGSNTNKRNSTEDLPSALGSQYSYQPTQGSVDIPSAQPLDTVADPTLATAEALINLYRSPSPSRNNSHHLGKMATSPSQAQPTESNKSKDTTLATSSSYVQTAPSHISSAVVGESLPPRPRTPSQDPTNSITMASQPQSETTQVKSPLPTRTSGPSPSKIVVDSQTAAASSGPRDMASTTDSRRSKIQSPQVKPSPTSATISISSEKEPQLDLFMFLPLPESTKELYHSFLKYYQSGQGTMKDTYSQLLAVCEHPDLVESTPATQQMGSSTQVAWSVASSPKFEFLKSFLDRVESRNFHVVVSGDTGEPGAMQLTQNFLRRLGHNYSRLGASEDDSTWNTSKLRITLIACHEKVEAGSLSSVDLIIGLGLNFKPTQVLNIRNRGPGVRPCPTLTLIIPNSIEHAEWERRSWKDHQRIRAFTRTKALDRAAECAHLLGVLPPRGPFSTPSEAGRLMATDLLADSLAKWSSYQLKIIPGTQTEPPASATPDAEVTNERHPEVTLRRPTTHATKRPLEPVPQEARPSSAKRPRTVSRNPSPQPANALLLAEASAQTTEAGNHSPQQTTSAPPPAETSARSIDVPGQTISSEVLELRSQLQILEAQLEASRVEQSTLKRISAEYDEALSVAQRRYEDRNQEFGEARKKLTMNAALLVNAKDREDKRSDTIAELRAQRAELQKDLAIARQESFQTSNDTLHEELSALRIKASRVDNLERSVKILNEQLDYIRQQYQTARGEATANSNEILELRAELEVYKQKASIETRKLIQMRNLHSAKLATSYADRSAAEVRQLKLELERVTNEKQKLKEDWEHEREKRGMGGNTRSSSMPPREQPTVPGPAVLKVASMLGGAKGRRMGVSSAGASRAVSPAPGLATGGSAKTSPLQRIVGLRE